MTNAVEDYQGELPEGWTGGQALMKWWRGKIMHLYTLRRPCAQCGKEMRIDVSKAALDGTAKNAGLKLKRCAGCRAASKALNSSSRPRVEGEAPIRSEAPVYSGAHTLKNGTPLGPIEEHELGQLRTANATMKDELEGLYTQNKELRKRLSKYELAPAMEAVASGQKMPWEN